MEVENEHKHKQDWFVWETVNPIAMQQKRLDFLDFNIYFLLKHKVYIIQKLHLSFKFKPYFGLCQFDKNKKQERLSPVLWTAQSG